MKAGDIVDAAIERSSDPVVIVMPNGDQIATTGYSFGENKRGEPVLIIEAGRNMTKACRGRK